jgi:hypothetical protein
MRLIHTPTISSASHGMNSSPRAMAERDRKVLAREATVSREIDACAFGFCKRRGR